MPNNADPRTRLTHRQAAVLAAVERAGRPLMADLWSEFPGLAPSAIKKVLDSLEKKGLVSHAGDEHQVYVNGVHWWSTALTPTQHDPKLAAIQQAFESAQLGLRLTSDPHDNSITVFLPLVELETHLRALPSGPMDRLRACVAAIEASGQPVWLAVSTKISTAPEPHLAVQIRPAAF